MASNEKQIAPIPKPSFALSSRFLHTKPNLELGEGWVQIVLTLLLIYKTVTRDILSRIDPSIGKIGVGVTRSNPKGGDNLPPPSLEKFQKQYSQLKILDSVLRRNDGGGLDSG
ncbi:MAG: hypothetical protein COX19_12065 [Desulfobacterales bacterium CG23_combo_of_CG06-09_8_20_14_all_51_8]|nr:MAG: hypothetical protein COX19_12065 [Desulfobacterales bacterium CG23_combo_of_CG06-09_8_20_14_all_51_8]